MTTVFGDKLAQAIEANINDIKTYTWKFPRKANGEQEEIKLVEATPEQLNQFYNHCLSMLYSTDEKYPGRYTLLDIISEQRRKCNTELFLRKLESGEICADGKPYPRYLYYQDIYSYMKAHKEDFPKDQLKEISVAAFSGRLPREFERVSIADTMDACLDKLGSFDNTRVSFSFLLSLGVYLTPNEMKELEEKDTNGKTRSKLEVLKEHLNIKNTVRLSVKPGGLNGKELRAMINLKPKKYTDLTTDQLITLRNKVLFRLEQDIQFHASQWEERLKQIEKVAESKKVQLVKVND